MNRRKIINGKYDNWIDYTDIKALLFLGIDLLKKLK
mgnify:CR=1 FL=1